jgi:hypothetical protein
VPAGAEVPQLGSAHARLTAAAPIAEVSE